MAEDAASGFAVAELDGQERLGITDHHVTRRLIYTDAWLPRCTERARDAGPSLLHSLTGAVFAH